MKKLVILSLALVFSLALAGIAGAKTHKFSHFSLDIPDDWKVQRAGDAFQIEAPDGVTTMAIAISEPEGDVEATGLTMMEALESDEGGLDEDGDFVFVFFKNDVPGAGVVTNGDGFMVRLIMLGDMDALQEIMDTME